MSGDFHDSNSSGPLINRLKYFLTRFQFRWDIRSQSYLHGVQYTPETISAVFAHRGVKGSKFRKKSQRRASLRGDDLCGVQHTVESRAPSSEKISTVCHTLWRSSLRCATYREDHPCGVQHTAETNCTPWSQIEIYTCLWLLLKGQSGEILLGVNISIMREKIWSIKCWFTVLKKNLVWKSKIL